MSEQRGVVTDREPTPTPTPTVSKGVGGAGDWSRRTRARVRASLADLPRAPELLLHAIDGDGESPLREVFPRCRKRLDWALTGPWCDPTNKKGRVAYLLATLLIACPLAAAVDLIDWATFPLGRLAVTATVVTLLVVVL